MDIVLYEDVERNKPYILIETKRIFEGPAHASNQAIRYVTEIPALHRIRYIVTTDGLRYWLYGKVRESWDPIAYMNFNNKRVRYSAYPKCEGMIGFIKHIME